MSAGLVEPTAVPLLRAEALREALEARRAAGLQRRRRHREGAQGARVQVDGRACLNFCGNDYLGLAAHPALIEAWCEGARRYGVGAASASLICGHTDAHRKLEEDLAAAVGRPRALLFSSGYMANIGALSALVGRGDGVYLDRLNHASLYAAARATDAKLRRFAHNDARALERMLDARQRRRLVAVEGVFGMRGDMAPVAELARAARRGDATLLIDDAHGFGVFGAGGGGVVEHFGLDVEQAPLLMATLGKALGVAGAFVAGDEAWIEYLLQSSSAYMHTTAMPPAQAVAAGVALRLMREEESWRRRKLHELIALFRAEASRLDLPLLDSESPIQPLPIGSARGASRWSEELWRRGFWVAAIRRPTVPPGEECLRVSLSAVHEEDDIARLLEALAAIRDEMRS